MVDFLREKSSYLLLPLFTLLGWFKKRRYDRIEKFCCFIGYSRSGHTIVGSMLDAHPDIVISTEADVFNLLNQGYRRNGMYFFLEFWSKFIARIMGNQWTGYDYRVPGWYQGAKKEPKIIGDKKGSKSLKRIMAKPRLTSVLSKRAGIPVKYVHVVRNPFDNIATMHNRSPEVQNVSNTKTSTTGAKVYPQILKGKIDVYFRKAKGVRDLLETQDLDVLHIHHEDLISKPKRTMKRLLKFLGLPVSKDYLAACAGIIFESPHKSRNSFEWPEDLKAKVEKKMQKIPFLADYKFEE